MGFHERRIAKMVEKFLDKDGLTLDFGAGNCLIAENLTKIYGFNIVPIDVADNNKTDLELNIYDGRKIPFKDNYFENTYIIFVLHHIDDKQDILKEVLRVTKNKILILEDTPKNSIEKLFWWICDHFINLIHNAHFSSAYRDAEWENLFERLNLKIVYKQNMRMDYVLKSYQNTLFVLEKL